MEQGKTIMDNALTLLGQVMEQEKRLSGRAIELAKRESELASKEIELANREAIITLKEKELGIKREKECTIIKLKPQWK